MSENSTVSISDSSEVLEVREEEIRCTGKRKNDGTLCNRLFTKAFIYTCVPKETKESMEKNHLSLSETYKGLEIKLIFETKCPSCKEMDYKIKIL